jgi:hypothetical protein
MRLFQQVARFWCIALQVSVRAECLNSIMKRTVVRVVSYCRSFRTTIIDPWTHPKQ